MFSQSEYQAIQKEFNQHQNKRRKKTVKIWGIVLAITTLIVIALLLIFKLYDINNDDTLVFYFLSGSTLFVLTTGLIVSFYYKSSKPYFEYVFPKIVTKINDEEGLYLSYEAYPKLDKSFNEEGGLFPKGVSISCKKVINGFSKEQDTYQIIDCSMTTSTGNNQVTHFYGTYIYLKKASQTELQIRTNGSPKNKTVKYVKLNEVESLKIYKPIGNELLEIDQRNIGFVNGLKRSETFRHLYLSMNKESIHLALWYKKNPLRKKKQFTLEVLNDYLKSLNYELDLVKELENLG